MTIFRTATRPADFDTTPTTKGLNESVSTTTDTSFVDPNYVTHSFRPFGDNVSIYGNFVHPEPSGNELWIHFNFRWQTGYNDDDGHFLYVYDSNGNLVFWIDVLNWNLTAYVYGESSASQSWNEMRVASVSPMDIRLVVDGLVTKAALFINNTFIKEISTPNTVPTVGKPARTLFTISDMGDNKGLYVSEIIVADEETRGMRLAQFSLTTAGTYSQFDEGDFSTSFDNNDGTGARSATALQKTSGVIGTYNGATTDYEIKDVIVKSRAWKTENSPIGDIRHFLRIGSTDYENSTLHAVSSDYRYTFNSSFTTNPATSSAWTFSDLVNLEAGLKTE